MQWSNAGDTTGQGTPDASSQPITTFSAGTNAHGVQCTAVVTQAKTAHFLSNIQKALQMTSKQLDALKVQVWNGNAGKPYPSNYDIASGADGRSKRYRAILASASVVHITTTENGQVSISDKAVIAFVFEVNGSPFVGLYVGDTNDRISLGLDYEPYPDSAFTANYPYGTGNTEVPIGVPIADFAKAVSQQEFNPNAILKPKYDTDGAKRVNFEPGSIVDLVTDDKDAKDLLDAVSGNNQGKVVDVKGAYQQALKDSLQDPIDYMPPFFFPGATQVDIVEAVYKTTKSLSSPVFPMRIISLRDATSDFGNTLYTLYPVERTNPQTLVQDIPPADITINGVPTKATPFG